MAAAVAGLTLAAGALGIPAAGGQTTDGCISVNNLDEMSVQVGSPTGTDPRTSPSVPIEVQATNTSTRKTLPTDPDPVLTRITARLVSCRDGQVLPVETQRSTTSPASDTMSLSWTPEPIPTNGPFAIEFVITGNRPGSPPQSSRVVTPFSLAVPPHRPNEVKASPSTDGGVVVNWNNADREADLVFYEVQRTAQGSANYVTVSDGVVPGSVNSASDRPGPGAWRYRVFAIRRGATEDKGVRSTPSTDATVEVASPPPTTAAPAGSGGTTTTAGSGSSTGSGSDTAAGTTGSSSATDTTIRNGPGGTSTVDLSNFAAALNARRQTQTTVRRIEPPDPGFIPTLPFLPRPPVVTQDDELVAETPSSQELGASEPNQGVGQRLISDDGDRRRSLGFVAFGLLLFVLSMTGLFVKGEVERADELEALDPPGSDGDALPPVDEHEGFADLAPVAEPRTRRARRSVAASDAPSLDVPEPSPATRSRTTTRTRTSPNARRTPPRLPSRPADDRRESDPAVRPRRRGAGEGNRRLPVG